MRVFQRSPISAVLAHCHRRVDRWPAWWLASIARANPARLAQATLYLPTRRAGRMAREIFLDQLNADAVVLPRIVALGDIDEDELAFAEEVRTNTAARRHWTFRQKLGELDRRLTLAHLVAAWAKSPVSAPLVVGGPAIDPLLCGRSGAPDG